MNKQTITLAVVGGIISAVVVGLAPLATAAPLSSSMTAFKPATLSDVTEVRYYRRGYYGRGYYNPGPAVALGILGAAAGAAAVGSGYYGPGYGYYGQGYGPGYGYYGNPYPYRRGYYA